MERTLRALPGGTQTIIAELEQLGIADRWRRLFDLARCRRYNGLMRLIHLAVILFATMAVCAQTSPSTIPTPSDLAAPPADAIKTASGLASKVITPGTGKDHPGKDEAVT